MKTQTQIFRGWGRMFRSRSTVHFPATQSQIPPVLQHPVIARGGGRSYGDAALNHLGPVLRPPEPVFGNVQFDATNGALWASAGQSQRQILELTAPNGWVLPAIPGSREITLGGMIAADAHGKNHYAASSTGRYVRALDIMLADGDIVTCSPTQEPDLYWATIGGLGLTGIVLRVEQQLRPIPSVYTCSEHVAFDGVEDLFALVEARKDCYEYILGTVDGRFAPDQSFRGVMAFGQAVAAQECLDPWRLPSLKVRHLPFPNPLPEAGWIAAQVLNRMLKRAFRPGVVTQKNLNAFFFPQDAISNWNVAFGRRGFLEYHCCLPLPNARDGLQDIHAFLCEQRILCSLVALKRFGPALVQAPLSFPMEGYSLALDMPVRGNLLEKLDTLDDIVIRHGGRVNPVKDSRLSPDTLRQMYPQLETWLVAKRHYDPGRVFVSDMARRLGLMG